MWFPTQDIIPESCIGEYQLKTQLGSGIYAKVFEACKDNGEGGCNYVAKVEPLTGITREQFWMEVEVTDLMGRYGVGPIMRSAWICNWLKTGGPYDVGMIVMDKAYITLFNYLKAQGLIGIHPHLSQVKFLYWKKIETMLSLGFLHLDIHSNNIMLNLEPNGNIRDLLIIDWNRVQQVPIYSGDNLIYFTTEIVNATWNKLLSGK